MPIILGGGISGLSSAYYLLQKANPSHIATVFEASNRLGGWIQTNVPTGDRRVRFEYGPRTIRPKGERGLNTLKLCSDIGLTDNILPIRYNHVAAKNRLLAIDDKLCLLPSSLSAAFKTIPPFSKPLISALFHDAMHPYKGQQIHDDTMYNFVQRRFGDEIAKYLISSMLCGICAGDAKEISVKFLLKDFFEMEQTHSSIVNGVYRKTINKLLGPKSTSEVREECELVKRSIEEKWSVYSLNDGLERLPQTLATHLQQNGVNIRLDSRCQHIEFTTKGVRIDINGTTHDTDYLVSSLPAFELGKLLQAQHPILADELNGIPYVDVAIVNLQFEGTDLLETPGFGFLVPPVQNSPILGVIFDSCCFDMGPNTVLTVMMGGKWFAEKLRNDTEHDIYGKAIEQIQRILKITKHPIARNVKILRKCIPQYVVGHYDRIDRISRYIEKEKIPLKLCGTAYDGVGVNDAIYSAKVMANSIQ